MVGDQCTTHSVSVLGSGWLGLPLVERLVDKGFRVNASSRSSSRSSELENRGVTHFVIDLSSESVGRDEFYDADILIINIPFKDVKKFEVLVRRIEDSSIQRVIFVSSTSVYGGHHAPITETDEHCLVSCPLLDIERLFSSNRRFKTTIVRFSGLVGYSRNPGRFFKSGRTVPNPNAKVNLIHRDDCINILDLIIEKCSWGEVYNGCADNHPTKREFYTHAAGKAGLPIPIFSEISDQDFKVVSNTKVKEKLGYHFVYPDVFTIEYPE